MITLPALLSMLAKPHRLAGAVLAASLLSAACQATPAVHSTQPAGRPLSVDSVDYSARDFQVAYTSQDSAIRTAAQLYLLGVMDSSEGEAWCDYGTFKTLTLRERVFLEFKKLEPSQLDRRAARVITHILSQRYPCAKQK